MPITTQADWRLEARCATESPDDFFPIGSGPVAQEQALRAKAVCRGCAVRRQCLEWALANDVRHGVFGGLDEAERLALRAPRRRRPAS
jgi:WhiB family redox-sensing transcriptional regulator